MEQKIRNWMDKTEVITELQEYIRHKSRSNHPEEVQECAEFAKKMLENAGLEVELIPTSGNALIFGSSQGDENYPSILFYGHYDVQPEGDLSLWDTSPFEPVIKGNKLYGRGSADNKGQHLAHIKAIEYLKLHHSEIFDKLNIKIILDGDEERGSFSLAEVFQERKSDLNSDVILVSDGPALVDDKPTIVGSVRGILTFQITIKHNPEDLHSGNFGGLARSATLDMIQLLSDMIEPSGNAKIPGFYDQVVEPTDFEREQLTNLRQVFHKIESDRGYATALTKEKSVIEQNQVWPTININGIQSGGVKKERRTIIPAEIVASLDCRLVPNMNSNDLKLKISEFIQNWAREHNCTRNVSIEFEHAMEPVQSSLNDPYLDLVKEAFTFGFNTDPLLVPRLGGSLPLYLFPKYLDKNVFLVPLALPDENNHAPNENLDIPYFKHGVISSVKLLQLLYDEGSKS